MELKLRIAEALQIAGKNARQAAAEAGLSDSAISQLLSGKTKSLKGSTAVKLEAVTGVCSGWLVTGEGHKMAAEFFPVKEMAATAAGVLDGILVPMLANVASMGGGEDLAEDDVLTGEITLTPQFVRDHVRPSQPAALRFIHAYGDSMAPTFSSGDILLVDSSVVEVKIDGIYVLQAHGRLFVKRVRQRMDGHFEISSDNPTHRTVDVLNGDHEVKIMGRVLWAWNGHRM